MYAGVPIIAPVRVSCTSNIPAAAACACSSMDVVVPPRTTVSGTSTFTSGTASRFASASAACSAGVEARSRSPCPDRSLAAMGPDWSPLAALSAAPDFSVTWRASPKSMTRTWLSRPTMTLSGLKSRCTSPFSCAAASPRPAAMNTFRMSCQLRAAACSQYVTVFPSTNSIAMNTCSWKVPTSKTTTTFGCESRAIACASRSVRWRPSWRETPFPGFTRSSLTATLRSSSGSYAA